MATLMERDVALVTKDASGNTVIEYPLTRAEQVEGLTDTIKAQAPSPANMKGATTSAAGTAGLAPAPAKGAANRYLRSDGTWAVPPDTNTTYTNMKGATTSAAGTAGLAPAPAKGAANRYLRSDGTWAVPPDTHGASESITVTASTQAAITPSMSSNFTTSQKINTFTVNTGGITAGTYTIQALLQKFVDGFHTHTAKTISGSNCNCNCDCGTDS